jgi:ABC-type dipeptide/oligopeptide/nickel transport system permease component
MWKYILRRLLITLPILLLVVTLVFLVFQIVPGDPARMYTGEQATQEEVDRVRAEFGLDQPLPVQYFNYLSRLARADLGRSIMTRRAVSEEILPRFWNTVQLAIGAIVFATLVGLVLGSVSAVKSGSSWDYMATILALVGISIPVFWLGLLLMYFFTLQLGILPSSGKDGWQYYIMPTITLSVFSLAFITRMTRSSLLDTINQDYVRTARAKGLDERKVLVAHALRNALLPVVTVVGLRFGYMLGGAVITEVVFAWPGMGRLLISAVSSRDIPVVQACLLVFATSFVLVNLFVDVLYAFVDPRIRYR